MISVIEGTALTSNDILTTSGVGYSVRCTHELEVGESYLLWVRTHVRENAITLFGFRSPDERSLFDALCVVTGVGPAAALSLLRDVGLEGVVQAVRSESEIALKAAKGVGATAARRIIADVKIPDGLPEVTSTPNNSRLDDVVAALVPLGYAEEKVRDVLKSVDDDDNIETLMNAALLRLAAS